MLVIETLFATGEAMTATELAALTGLSPSAMSYHLRALERFGVIVAAPSSGRERPWRRAAQDLSIALKGETAAATDAAATGAIMETAMSSDRRGLMAVQQRQLTQDRSVPLDAAARFRRATLMVTVSEAKSLLKQIDQLLLAFQRDRRRSPPAGAGELHVSIISLPEIRPTPRS